MLRGAHADYTALVFWKSSAVPGPLNVLYVSCNLILRRSVRWCADRRVIYRIPRHSGVRRATRLPG